MSTNAPVNDPTAPPAPPATTDPVPPPPPPVQDTVTIPVPPPPAPAPASSDKTFSTADIERARQEEKDKLYERLQNQENELRRLREAEEARAKAIEDERKAAEEAARKKAEEDMSAKDLLAQKEQEWNQRFAQIEAQRQQSEAILEKERQFAELERYKAERMAEVGDQIMPELRDMVTGTSREEIDQSLASLQERTMRIVENIRSAQQQQRAGMKGVPVTAPPVGPLDNDPTHQTFSAEDIRNMSIEDYAKHREQFLRAGSGNNRGLLG